MDCYTFGDKMPGTARIILTRAERRSAFLQTIREDAGDWICAFLLLSCSIGAVAGFSYWIYAEWTAAQIPIDCFDRLQDCQVLTVDHQFNGSATNCSDIFTYRWSLPGSRAVFVEEEVRRRSIQNCLLDLDISSKNATFQPGSSSCFRIKGQFDSYAEAFNCATLVASNGSTVGLCQTLLTPTSDHDATFALVVSILMLLLMSCFCCVTVGAFLDEDEY